MKTFTRREYNLVVKCLNYYETFMSEDDKKLSEIIQDKLYYFNADCLVDSNKNEVNLAALYDIQTEKDLSEDNKNEQELSYVDSLLTTGIDSEFDTPLAEQYGG